MHLHRMRILVLVVLVSVLVALPGAVGAAPAPPPTEGVINAIDAASFTVTASNGSLVRVMPTADTRIIRRQPARLEDIKPHDFVAVTAKREPDGSLTAISINIIPPEFRGQVRQVQFQMETGNIMTNAMVFQNVRRVDGRTLYLKLPDGSTVITVPKEAEVFRLTVLKVSDLKVGMRVVVRGGANPDGSITAASVTVEESR